MFIAASNNVYGLFAIKICHRIELRGNTPGQGRNHPAQPAFGAKSRFAIATKDASMRMQGSISRIETDNPRLHAFEVNGKIRRADIEWMAQALEPALKQPGKIDIIIVMTDYDGIELGAAFDPKALREQARATTEVRKYAVVGAPGWAEAMINMMSPLSPIEARTFDLEEAGEAWRWVQA
jgi:hypothetical protein